MNFKLNTDWAVPSEEENNFDDESSIKVKREINILELGFHLGDGTLNILEPFIGKAGNYDINIFSTETNMEWLGDGQRLVQHALGGIENNPHIRFTAVADTADVSDGDFPHITRSLLDQHNVEYFDFVFFDHDSERFASDLNFLVEHNQLRDKAVVMADNIGVNRGGRLQTFFEEVSENKNFENVVLKDVFIPYRDKMMVATYTSKGSAKRDEL